MDFDKVKTIYIKGKPVIVYSIWVLPFFSSYHYMVDAHWLYDFLHRAYAKEMMVATSKYAKIRVDLASGDRIYLKLNLVEYEKFLDIIDSMAELSWSEWGF